MKNIFKKSMTALTVFMVGISSFFGMSFANVNVYAAGQDTKVEVADALTKGYNFYSNLVTEEGHILKYDWSDDYYADLSTAYDYTMIYEGTPYDGSLISRWLASLPEPTDSKGLIAALQAKQSLGMDVSSTAKKLLMNMSGKRYLEKMGGRTLGGSDYSQVYKYEAQVIQVLYKNNIEVKNEQNKYNVITVDDQIHDWNIQDYDSNGCFLSKGKCADLTTAEMYRAILVLENSGHNVEDIDQWKARMQAFDSYIESKLNNGLYNSNLYSTSRLVKYIIDRKDVATSTTMVKAIKDLQQDNGQWNGLYGSVNDDWSRSALSSLAYYYGKINPVGNIKYKLENITIPTVIKKGQEEYYNKNISLKEGATALDVLKASGLPYEISDSGFVSSINGVKNEGASGWMYSVNGEVPMVTADKYILKDGDKVQWYYITYHEVNLRIQVRNPEGDFTAGSYQFKDYKDVYSTPTVWITDGQTLADVIRSAGFRLDLDSTGHIRSVGDYKAGNGLTWEVYKDSDKVTGSINEVFPKQVNGVLEFYTIKLTDGEYNDPDVKKEYTVTVNDGSNKTSTKIKEGELFTKPEDPKREGYTFKGWYVNDKEFDFNTKITSDITLTALWEADKISVLPEANKGFEYIKTLFKDSGEVTYSNHMKLAALLAYDKSFDSTAYLNWLKTQDIDYTSSSELYKLINVLRAFKQDATNYKGENLYNKLLSLQESNGSFGSTNMTDALIVILLVESGYDVPNADKLINTWDKLNWTNGIIYDTSYPGWEYYDLDTSAAILRAKKALGKEVDITSTIVNVNNNLVNGLYNGSVDSTAEFIKLLVDYGKNATEYILTLKGLQLPNGGFASEYDAVYSSISGISALISYENLSLSSKNPVVKPDEPIVTPDDNKKDDSQDKNDNKQDIKDNKDNKQDIKDNNSKQDIKDNNKKPYIKVPGNINTTNKYNKPSIKPSTKLEDSKDNKDSETVEDKKDEVEGIGSIEPIEENRKEPTEEITNKNTGKTVAVIATITAVVFAVGYLIFRKLCIK